MSDDPRFDPPNFGAQFETGIPDLNVSVEAQAATIPAGFWIRFVAAIVDGVIVNVATLPLTLLVGVAAPLIGGGLATKAVLQVVNVIITWGIMYFYYGWFYSNKGATPGKLMLGLKVLNVENGAHLGYWPAFFRETLGKLLSGLLLMIGFIMAGVRSDKRALHDLIFNTQVIKTK